MVAYIIYDEKQFKNKRKEQSIRVSSKWRERFGLCLEFSQSVTWNITNGAQAMSSRPKLMLGIDVRNQIAMKSNTEKKGCEWCVSEECKHIAERSGSGGWVFAGVHSHGGVDTS